MLYIEKEIYFKELSHMIMEPSKAKMYRLDGRAEDPGERHVAVHFQKVSAQKSLFTDGGQSLFY